MIVNVCQTHDEYRKPATVTALYNEVRAVFGLIMLARRLCLTFTANVTLACCQILKPYLAGG